MREPMFRGVTRGVHRHGHASHVKRCDRKSCSAPDVFVTFDVDRPVGQSYKFWEVGKPPEIVWEFGSASTAKGGNKEMKDRCRVSGVLEYWLYAPQSRPHRGVGKASGWRTGVKGRCQRSTLRIRIP